jgi:predicted amidohydrolase YtcJ
MAGPGTQYKTTPGAYIMTARGSILANARIHTMNTEIPSGSCLHIEEGRIRAVLDGITPDEPGLEKLDLEGRTVMPGLCDAHIHIEKYAQILDQIDCETQTLEECLRKVEKRCKKAPPSDWVLGHGWDQNRWGGYGSLIDLDSVSPNNPVYLTAKSLHAGWANSKALALCGISNTSDDPPKGKLQRDSQGQLTGILFEDALLFVSTKIPKPDESELTTMILRAQERLLDWGITGIHDYDGLLCLRALHLLEKDAKLKLRVLKQIREKEFVEAVDGDFRTRYDSDWIRIGHLKLFSDGALGPRTAAMLEPYEGEPGNLGMLLFSQEELVEIGQAAIQAGYPMAIHAIGDRANRTVLDAFEQLLTLNLNTPPFPHRIEHVQLLDKDDVPRLAELGISASMQPIHAVSDHLMADKYWGKRVRWSYAWNAQFTAGAQVMFGSDAPVESPDPWAGIHAATTRKPLPPKNNSPAWIPEECVSLSEALKAYTKSPAQFSAWRSFIGQLGIGFSADLIVLDQDPFLVGLDGIAEIQPCGVMVDGEWVIRNF